MNGAFCKVLVLSNQPPASGEAEAMDAWQDRLLHLLVVCPSGPALVVGATASTMHEAKRLCDDAMRQGAERVYQG